jgi:hypothetical protein
MYHFPPRLDAGCDRAPPAGGALLFAPAGRRPPPFLSPHR